MLKKTLAFSVAILVSHGSLMAQDATSVEDLRKQLQELQDAQRRQLEQIQSLTRQVEALSARTNLASATDTVSAPPISDAATNSVSTTAIDASLDQTQAPVVQGFAGRTYMDMGLVGTFAAGTSTAKDIEGALENGGHDPNQRGFTVQGLEASFSGAVDPYFRGSANVVFSLDSGGESFVELEEGWLETISLPGKLQVRAGQILTEFGRQNPTHLHSWPTVDAPLVLGRMFGPDGLRNPGARLSWLAPTPFFSEFMVSIQDSQGSTAESFRNDERGAHGNAEGVPLAFRRADNDRGFSSLGDLLITPRYSMSFDLTDSQTLLAGASAAFGPNSRGGQRSGETRTQIYGVDLTWKWKSPSQHGGFPFVAFQSEALLRKYDVGAFNWDLNRNGLAGAGEITDASTGLPAFLRGETLTDYGFYSQVQYGFRKGWVAGLRFDYVTGDRGDYEDRNLVLDGERLGRDLLRAERWRLSPNLTWYPSEFSKIRLQYNYDDRSFIGEDHSVWLEFEFLLGAHAAHKF